jgi:pyruvate kinase
MFSVASRGATKLLTRPQLVAAPFGVHAGNRFQARTIIDLDDIRLNKLPPTGTQTKIICTIGPASDGRIPELMAHGMHCARLNFSHAGDDYSYPESIVEKMRSSRGNHKELIVGRNTDVEVPNNLRAVLVDTKGPEIRTGPLPGNEDVSTIEIGARVTLTTYDVSGEPIPKEGDDDRTISIDYMSIAKTVKVGSMILLDDGLIALEVEEVDPSGKVVCIALNAGPIKKNKGVNLPGMELDLPALTEKDRRDLEWACKVGADFIAASFIRTGANVRSVIAFLERCIADLPETSGKPRIRPLVISKIENKEGVDNFDEILEESDGIMVARGDVSVRNNREMQILLPCNSLILSFPFFSLVSRFHTVRFSRLKK